jgi:hypothetical protein
MTSKPLPRLATARSRHQSGLPFAPGAGSLWARYAAHVSGWNGETDDGLRRQVPALRMGCQDIVELRRRDHSGARLHLERERDKTGEEVVAHSRDMWTAAGAAGGSSPRHAPVKPSQGRSK